jgi:rubrerythrin
MATSHGSDSDREPESGERRSFRDVPTELGGERTYECYTCGAIRVADDAPGACSECGASVRNRGAPLE